MARHRVEAEDGRPSPMMNIRFVRPRPELRPFIESLWVLESPFGLPVSDRSVVAPNGCAKLIIPCENPIVSVAGGRTHVSHERQMYFVGNRDSSTFLRTRPGRTTFITIEFRPEGAFPIFGLPMSATFNRISDGDGVFGRWSRETRERIDDSPSLARKVAYVQERLVELLRRHEHRSEVVEACVRSLRASDGRVSIRHLQRATGFSWRYIDRLFQEHVGLSPKVLAGIFRFQKFYRRWADGSSFDELKDELYDYYYDQSHFTREFHRMTGHSPQRFIQTVPNEFGRRLLLGQNANPT
jgi:AraC-like DNA-binding protein